VVITDGRQPVGNGIGPVLEARDVMRVLKTTRWRPGPAPEVAAAGRPPARMRPRRARRRRLPIARDILDSGRALARKMQAIIEAQGARLRPPPPGAGGLELRGAGRADGVVTGIDNLQIARIARWPARPRSRARGWTWRASWATRCAPGDLLYRVYADYPSDLEFARQACARAQRLQLGRRTQMPQVFVEF
jgi:thymidine phosphorylase